MKQEFKIGQRVKIHSGANVTDSNNRIGIITHIDKETTIQPHITVEFENGDKNQNGETIAICYPMSYRKFNVEILSEPNTKTQNMTQTISRKGLKEIYDVACPTWQGKIKAIATKDVLLDTIELSQAQIDEMFKASSEPQKEVLRKYLKEEVLLKASDLKIGEIMEIIPQQQGCTYVMRTYSEMIGFDKYMVHQEHHAWGTELCFTGRKLTKGTALTITAG